MRWRLIASSLLDDIRTDPFLKYMYNRVLDFDKYLEATSACSINIKGLIYDPESLTDNAPDAVQYDLEYLHRWTKKYDHRMLWKLYNLAWHYRLNPNQTPNYTMMITLTGSHASPRYLQKDGLRHMAYLAKFHDAHRKSKDLMRKYLKTGRYLSMLEGHPESGFVHAHDLYFLDESPQQKTLENLEHHWNKTLGMGSAEHGMKIEIKEPRDFEDIKSFIAYPMSYVGKTTIGDLPEWTKYDVIFNTCLWLSARSIHKGGIGHRVRAFQPSRALSKIMNQPSLQSGYIHIETVLSNKNRNDSVLFQSPSYDVNIKAWETLGGDSSQIHVPERFFGDE
jgi:hypothetical protein